MLCHTGNRCRSGLRRRRGWGGGGGGDRLLFLNQKLRRPFLPNSSTSSRSGCVTLRRLALASVAIVGSRLLIVPVIFFAL